MGLRRNERQPFVDAVARLRPDLHDIAKDLNTSFDILADFADPSSGESK